VVPAAEYLLLFRGQDTSGVGQSLAFLVVVPPPLTSLSRLFGCILIPKRWNETGKRHNSVFDGKGDIAGRAYFRIPFELAQDVLAGRIVRLGLRSSFHGSPSELYIEKSARRLTPANSLKLVGNVNHPWT
jgi:hypothetical protein